MTDEKLKQLYRFNFNKTCGHPRKVKSWYKTPIGSCDKDAIPNCKNCLVQNIDSFMEISKVWALNHEER